MLPSKYIEIVRSNAGRAALAIGEAIEPAVDASGVPLPFKVSQAQAEEVQGALNVIRRTLVDLCLEANVAAVEGHRKKSSTRGKPASAAARASLY